MMLGEFVKVLIKYSETDSMVIVTDHLQKQPSRGVLKKKCSENVPQIYRRIPKPKCNFNNVTKQLDSKFNEMSLQNRWWCERVFTLQMKIVLLKFWLQHLPLVGVLAIKVWTLLFIMAHLVLWTIRGWVCKMR